MSISKWWRGWAYDEDGEWIGARRRLRYWRWDIESAWNTLRRRVGRLYCRRAGHDWNRWGTYGTSMMVLMGDGPSYYESGENWACRRCDATEKRNVRREERPAPRISWSEPEKLEDWQSDPEAWKAL